MSVNFSAGVLAVWTDVVTEHEAEFNSWYSEEHLPERQRCFASLLAWEPSQSRPRPQKLLRLSVPTR